MGIRYSVCNVENARLEMTGLIYECPYGGNPTHCPLHEVRKQSMQERFDWLQSLSSAELIDYQLQHEQCICMRQLMSKSQEQTADAFSTYRAYTPSRGV